MIALDEIQKYKDIVELKEFPNLLICLKDIAIRFNNKYKRWFTTTQLSNKTIADFQRDYPNDLVFNEESLSRIEKAWKCLYALRAKGFLEGFEHLKILDQIFGDIKDFKATEIPIKSIIMIEQYQEGFIMTNLVQHLLQLNNKTLEAFSKSLEELDISYSKEDSI